MKKRINSILLLLAIGFLSTRNISQADVSVPNIFGDHMVLQQKQANRIWGKADAGERVIVGVNRKRQTTSADSEGHWSLMIDPLPVGGPYTITVTGRGNRLVIKDVLVGEVWICSGQSNMEWPVASSQAPDLERAGANFPRIRMINYPNVGRQEPVWTHDDSNWMVCSPETVPGFSAVGYAFGRQLHNTLGVPIGLINNAWGGSAADAWINRDLLKADEPYKPTLDRWKDIEAKYASLSAKDNLSEADEKQATELRLQLEGNQRPANIYNGVLKSHLGYGIKGAIWYQGESNAERAYQYRHIFPMMIQNWRSEWGQGDFPFYWVQLADYRSEVDEPGESDWAELREAQTMTLSKLPNTGEAVIIDIGEGKDIHPQNKVVVGQRLARWALAKDYQINVAYQSPTYKSMEKQGNKIILSFEHVDGGWRPFDVNEPVGFAIAGANRKFVWAKAVLKKDGRIEVSSDQVTNPVAVRYAWGDNPVCNMFDGMTLPLTPFRTDDWPGVTANTY